jgi:hypothetical protein
VIEWLWYNCECIRNDIYSTNHYNIHIKQFIWEVYYTSCHYVLCSLCKQVEQSDPDGKLEDMAEGTNKGEATLES